MSVPQNCSDIWFKDNTPLSALRNNLTKIGIDPVLNGKLALLSAPNGYIGARAARAGP